MIRLKIRDRVVELTPGEYTVGRSRRCDVQVSDESVSRLHARLYVEAHMASIEDLGSTNGTYVNGRRIEVRTHLTNGARVHLGRALLVVEIPPPEVVPTTVPTAPSPPLSPPVTASLPSLGIQPRVLPLAGVGLRFLALLIDGVLTALPWLLAIPAFWVVRPLNTAVMVWLVAAVFSILVVFINDVVLMATRGRSMGKATVGLQVCTVQGQTPIGWRRAILRFLGRIPSILPLGLGYGWALVDKRRQTWHDKIAGTLVIRERRH